MKETKRSNAYKYKRSINFPLSTLNVDIVILSRFNIVTNLHAGELIEFPSQIQMANTCIFIRCFAIMQSDKHQASCPNVTVYQFHMLLKCLKFLNCPQKCSDFEQNQQKKTRKIFKMKTATASSEKQRHFPKYI